MKNLKLINFQSHKSFEIEFDPKVTTILGRSDIGKSAIIRSLYWLTFNRPGGKAFILHDKQFAKVSLQVDNLTIHKIKGKKTNCYKINKNKYSAIGRKVPEPVSKALNLGPVNFQMQHDPPFWLHLSPGELAKEVNRIIRLDEIDLILSRTISHIRKIKTQQEVSESLQKKAKDELSKLKWMDEYEKELNKIEEVANKKSKIDIRYNTLQEAFLEWNEVKLQETDNALMFKEMEDVLEKIDFVIRRNKVIKLMQEYERTRKQLCQRINEIQNECIVIEEKLKEKNILCPMCGQRIISS